ncbi:MAG: hypothetical protein V3V20_00570, partial [Algisphaera sp.]
MPRPPVQIELRPERILMAIELLIERIEYRLPGRGLGRTASDLRAVAGHAVAESAEVQKPYRGLRFAGVVLALIMVAVLIKFTIGLTHYYKSDADIWDLLSGIEAAISTLVYLGLAGAFLFTVEMRLKRRRVLAAMQELRALAHVLDMHQFSKDPERLIHQELLDSEPGVDADGPSLSPFLTGRYLDYCSELLSLTGKVAALYARNTQDSVV